MRLINKPSVNTAVPADSQRTSSSAQTEKPKLANEVQSSAGFSPLFSREAILARPYAPTIENENVYHQDTFTFKGRVNRTFSSNLPIITGPILEVGCSDGLVTRELAEKYTKSNIVGIDVSVKALLDAGHYNKELVQQGRVIFMPADGYNLKLSFDESARFSAIFFMNNLVFGADYMEPEKIRSVISQTKPFLQESGYLLLSGDENYTILQKKEQKFSIADFLIAEFRDPSRFVFGIHTCMSRAEELLDKIGRALDSEWNA